MNKNLRVQKIKTGTVIDHLPPFSSKDVINLLGINRNFPDTISIVVNVESRKGKKDVVKIENRILKKKETNKQALLAPQDTVNIIKEYEVVEKKPVQVPNRIEDILKCNNQNCITNKNEPLTTIFTVEEKNPIILRCTFCEKIMDSKDIEHQL